MFPFLTPAFLWAGIAATIPLILHLMQSRRTARVLFSTIRFLKMAERKSSRRVKMEHFILWLLRTLLILLLAAAFAMPILRTGGFGSFLGRAHRDVAIVIDTSYSMNYITGGETVWDKAVETAAAIVEGLSERDRFCIFLAGRDSTPLIEQLSGDRETATARLKDLRPDYTPSRLGPAVTAANDALKDEQRRREREIHIITDGQALPWHSFDTREPAGPAERSAVFVSLLGATSPENAAPREVKVDPPVIMTDMPVGVEVGLTGSGAPRDTTVALYVDGREIARRAVSRAEDRPNIVSFTIPPLGAGSHAARVETPADNLPLDDTFHFLVRARDQMPTLCVGSPDATLFLRLALTAGPEEGSGIGVKTILPEAMAAESLSAYACLFLCDALPLPGQAVMQVEQYVRDGGLLVVMPGDGSRSEDYAVWRCLPGVPAAIADRPASERTCLLRWQDPHHPLLRMLRRGIGAPVVTVRRRLAWTELHEDAEVLVTAGAEEPFLVSRPFGRGRVLCLSVSANRSWSDFPLSPYYLPLVHQLVQFAAGMGRFSNYLWAADSVPLKDYLPEAGPDSSLLDPAGSDVSIRNATVDGKTILHAEHLVTPGIYTLSTPARPSPEPALAVNISRKESDLTPIDPATVPGILGTGNVVTARNKADLLRRIEEHRVGKTFGETLLWLALLVAVVEVAYSNILVKEVSRLSDLLPIDAAGKVANP